jgi:hypothetical protein
MNSDLQNPELPPSLDKSGKAHPDTGTDNPPPEDSRQSKFKIQNSKIDSPNLPNSQTPELPDPVAACAYRGNGFVARLPKTMRDQLNQMMLDGVSYPKIIKSLGAPASHLKPDHLSERKKRGHKDWLLQQDWLADRRARRESATDLLQDCDATQVNQGALHLGTLYIFDALRELRAGSLDDKLGGDSGAFARLLNALSRASRESLQLQKYREACAKARAALQPLRDPKRKLTENENRSLVLMVDNILGLPSQDDPSPIPSATEDASSKEQAPPPEPPPAPPSPGGHSGQSGESIDTDESTHSITA